ncbi:MAG: hypothetical protein HQK60_11115 [Deltaproteobacteria bacterium]|nr:hypothetical protein [Deltaproteobacteria bacterium]
MEQGKRSNLVWILGPYFLVVFIIFAQPCLGQATAPLVKQADELYAARADPAKVKGAIEAYKNALIKDPKNDEAAYKLCRAYYFLATHAAPGEQLRLFELGVEAGKKAIDINPNSLGGHFWLGVCYGKYGLAKGVIKSLALVDPIKKEMAAVIEQDPSYEHGGAYRVLGRLYAKLPGLAGGSNSKAIDYLKTSIKYGPDRLLTRVYLAEVYIDTGQRDLAKKELEDVLKAPVLKGWEVESKEEKAEAKALLDKLSKEQQ